MRRAQRFPDKASFKIKLSSIVSASNLSSRMSLHWKVSTELLYPISAVANDGFLNMNIFEFIERWGDYAVPVALIFIQQARRARLPDAAPVTEWVSMPDLHASGEALASFSSPVDPRTWKWSFR